jgi:hypothetical protein
LALVVALWRPEWATAVAMPLFLLWLFIMALIWAFLLGIARIVTGHFTIPEVILTLTIGAASLMGLVAAVRARSGPPRFLRVAAFVLFAAMQIAVMWLSRRWP